MKIILSLVIASLIGSNVFLKSSDELEKSIARGKMVYSENCISCHMGTGEGVTGTFPPLAQSDYLIEQQEESIRAIKYGLIGKITVNGVPYDNMMPSPGLDDEEIADVMNYILNTWDYKSDQPMITAQQVKLVKEE
ncbi:mono/diheme cytochrome c family protein [Dyadobacter jejuensis]|uniref:Mono/diheme cytochrome c family protein n=1 Tax=Dyadobacter jejuensis TaxID=1082580 RepID=A0A316ABQ0_9BACT|nr:cytochrome c [Dyadobacter jejuensis]PWJ54294.1 mono/diheme cytochrome c family protein [Dyadobacter jejuensis]